ncbi:transcriptional regulator [Vibrio tarriae]|nr:transcriptional regulator [Vibrio tarriae]
MRKFSYNLFVRSYEWQIQSYHHQSHNKRLKRDCQRVAFPVPMSRGGCSCCV